MHRYRCDACGCYLDPGEGRQCEECDQKAKRRTDRLRSINEAVKILDSGQYEMMMDRGGYNERD